MAEGETISMRLTNQFRRAEKPPLNRRFPNNGSVLAKGFIA
jgi:hypothetical protein